MVTVHTERVLRVLSVHGKQGRPPHSICFNLWLIGQEIFKTSSLCFKVIIYTKINSYAIIWLG